MLRKTSIIAAAALLLTALNAAAQTDKPEAPGKGTAITIYNQNFALVRQVFPMELNAGVNRIRFADATAFLEPESVILRDLNGRTQLQILEQNYRNDPITQELLLSLYEGKTIDFEVRNQDGRIERIAGKIIRSGYVPHPTYNEYGQAYPGYGAGQPIIEVDGKLRFGLPGLPIFPNLGTDTILHPTINWLLNTPSATKLDAEVSYVTSGLSWAEDYNIVAPVSGSAGSAGPDGEEKIDVFGLVSFNNHSGKLFDEADIKLIAGDVNKLQPGQRPAAGMADEMRAQKAEMSMAPTVREKSFDEYHMYSLARSVTLHDNETKQVEFVRGTGVKSKRIYVYDGAKLDRWYGYSMETARNDQGYGTDSNPKVWVMQEFKNSKENGLGIALPKGKLRFYRRDDDGKLEFTGENWIDHTPVDELIRVYTGNAFDVVGERRRTDIKVNSSQDWIDESFEVKVRNHKKTAVTVRVVEHLYRWSNWNITAKTTTFRKKDAQTIEFPVTIAPNGEAVINYTVHYSW